MMTNPGKKSFNPDQSAMTQESIRHLLMKQKEGIHAIDRNIDALSFLAAVLKQTSMNDDARLDYPEISGLAAILEHIREDMTDHGVCELPYVSALEDNGREAVGRQ